MVDGVGQSGSDRPGDHTEDGVSNGHSVPWAARRAHESWSSAGAALEPEFEPLTAWHAIKPDRRGIDALSGESSDDPLTSTLLQPGFAPLITSLSAEDPLADELAQRSADFARHAAGFDEPTPAQGLPQLSWSERFEQAAAAASAASEVAELPAMPVVPFSPLSGQPLGEPPPQPSWIAAGPGAPTTLPETLSPWEPTPLPEAPTLDSGLATAPLEGSATAESFESRFKADDPFRRDNPFGREAFRRDNPFGRGDDDEERDSPELPKRTPSHPDVPPRLEQLTPDEPLEDKAAQLSKIVSHLQRDDEPPAERPDGFDVEAVLEAVRSVAGVREASLRTTPAGARHLRLELAEGADPGTISRMVARMLQDQMGINAALAGMATPPPQAPPAPPMIPGQAEPVADETPPVVLPGPRTGLGAAPPPAVENPPSSLLDRGSISREQRRRHPVSVPRRSPSELRGERPAAMWRANSDNDGAAPPALITDREQGPRAVIEHVQTSTYGLDATVEVRLTAGGKQASGVASGPAVDAYVLRLSAAATAAAIDDLLRETSTGETGRCYVEHAAIVPMGSCEVAVVVVLLMCGGWVEQLAGSALIQGDPRRAVVRATLAAVNRRLAALLP